MKLLADENFPPTLVSYLQKKRHDVKRVQRAARGISDPNIRERARTENRIIITFDKDFSVKGETPVSVMLLDFPKSKPDEIIPYMDIIVQAMNDLKRKKKPFIATYSKNGLEVK